jgi:hypothetical protein
MKVMMADDDSGSAQGGAATDLGRRNSKQPANGMVFSVNSKRKDLHSLVFNFEDFLIEKCEYF